MGTFRARVMIQVAVGVLPGTPESTKNFVLTSEEFYRQASDDGDTTFDDGNHAKGMEAMVRVHNEALEYARSQMNPAANNWVKLEWVWM